jgi:hypothetical protein
MILWHVNRVRYQPGSVISPTWGHKVVADGPTGRHWGREQRLESVRAAEFPTVPSRMHCTFAWDNIDDAIGYAEHDNHLYQVVPESRSCAICRLDWLWVTWVGEHNTLADRDLQCRLYWQGACTKDYKTDAMPKYEVLVGGGLRVLGETSLAGRHVGSTFEGR